MRSYRRRTSLSLSTTHIVVISMVMLRRRKPGKNERAHNDGPTSRRQPKWPVPQSNARSTSSSLELTWPNLLALQRCLTKARIP